MLIERVSYNINWRTFRAGTSFFVPCLDCVLAKAEILKVSKRLKMDVLTKVCIEEGVRGIRTWRL